MSISRFVAVLGTSLVACGVTTLGILIVRRYASWSRERSTYFVSFAAGVLMTVSLMHIVPESLEMDESASPFILVGFLGLHILNRFLTLYLCHDHDCPDLTVGVIPMLGIGLHSLIDGVIYSITFSVSALTGVLAAVGMVFHEFPEGVLTYALLERGGFSAKRATIYAFLAAALSTPLGVLISYPFIHRIEEESLGSLLGLAGGALVYVGATHLLPEVEEQDRLQGTLTLALGVVVGIIIITVGGRH